MTWIAAAGVTIGLLVSGSLLTQPSASAGRVRAPESEVILADFTPDLREEGARNRSSDLKSSADANASPGGLGPTDKKAGAGCSVQCITSGVAFARNAGAELRVETDTPARIWILVWNDDYARLVDSGNGSLVTSFDFHFDDLEAGTTYQAIAEAVDSQGFKSEAPGHFDTLRRAVEIRLSGAEVTNHAFDQSHFKKYLWVEGEWLDDYEASGLELQQGILYWGENEIFVQDTDRNLDLAVQLAEANGDVDGLQEGLGSPGSEPEVWGNSNESWSYAWLEDDDLDDRPADATSWTEHTLHRTLQPAGDAYGLPPGFGYPFTFFVQVTLHVTYY
jgi:hypothetical protein